MTMHADIVSTLDVSVEAQSWEDRHLLERADQTLTGAIEMLTKFRDAVRDAGGDVHKLIPPTLHHYHSLGEVMATIGALGAIRELRLSPEMPIVIRRDPTPTATSVAKGKSTMRKR